MADLRVSGGTTVKLGRVEGELKVGNDARIQSADGTAVVVTGGAEFHGNAEIECDFECQNLTVHRSGKLRVNGNLTVNGPVDVSNSIVVEKLLKAETVDVGGHVNVHSLSCKRMRVGGTAEVSELLQAETVDVGGKIEARGRLEVKDLQVGGKAEVGGGAITGTINIGGKFESLSKLEFGELQIFGFGSIAAGSSGKKILTSGKLQAEGDLHCDEMEVNGVTLVAGDCDNVRVVVKGKFDVKGSLAVSERLDVHGSTDVRDTFNGGALLVNGRFSADKALVSGNAEVHGSIETRKGLKAKEVLVGSSSRCRGPIVAEVVEVGASGPGLSAFVWGQRLRVQAGTSQVDDIYSSRFVLGPGSRAGRIFSESVELGPGCDAEEVTYVTGLKVDAHVKIAHPVKKVDKLGEPPL